MSIAREYKGKVYVVDNQRISVTQEQSVYDAMYLRDKGMCAEEIKNILEKEKLQASIYITVDTLEVFEKRRKNHSGGCGDRNCIEFEAGSSDSG